MEHVAIDLGSRESHVCRRGPEGSMLESRRVRTAQLKEYLATLAASRFSEPFPPESRSFSEPFPPGLRVSQNLSPLA